MIFKQFLVLSFLALTTSFALWSQGSADGYFYVYPKTSQAQPDGNNRSNSAVLNSLLDQYDVVSYVKSFPGAPASSFISGAYEMHFNGDVVAFLQALYNSDLFNYVDPTSYAVSLAASEPDCELESEVTLSNCPSPLTVNDPYAAGPPNPGPFNNRWNIDVMEMECAWSITTGNPDIVIAVVDTEFENDHPDLVGQLLPDWERVPGDEVISINGEHHGTTVMADAVAIPNNGICIAGTGYNSTGKGYVVPYTGGLTAAIWPGIWTAGYIDKHPIINVSWVIIGGWLPFDPNPFPNPFPTELPTISEAVQLIVDQGSLIILGAGNDSNPDFLTHEGTPYASIPGVVIASGVSPTLRHGPTNGRDYAEVDLCAPSKNLNTIRRGEGAVSFHAANGGTSHAAPFVSGIAALCLDVNPCLTPPELEALLKGTTSPIADAANFPGTIGTGYVNAYQAVLAASQKLNNYSITTDETWDYPRRIEGTLTIQSGAKLTVTSTIACAFDSKIVVEPGGELFVDGGRLRRDCENEKYWKGIEVKGIPSANQFTSGIQGKVRLTNALIEDAEIAVSLFHRQTYAQGGGILLANNSTFLNCQNGVAIAKYTNTFPGGNTPVANLSQIQGCTFTINDDFHFDQGGEHIQLDRITRVNIFNSVLEDERTSYAAADDLQDGIWSSNATFWLSGNNINRMRYGIKAENIKSGRTFKVTDNVFESNFFGIASRAVDNFEAVDNNFTVGGFDGPTSEFNFPNRQTGIHIDQSSGFFIEDNDFMAAAGLPVGTEPVGLAVNNTNVGTAGELNSDFNDIFRNTYTGLYRANVANGQNSNPSPDSDGGLRYFCNQNITNLCTDFTVFDGTIAPEQITPSNTAAGNTFTQDDSCNPFSDFDNSNGNFITYNYYDQSTGNTEEPVFTDPGNFNSVTAQINQCTDTDSSPGPFPPGGEGGAVAQFPTIRQNYLNLRQQHNNQLDGGDTDYLLSAIAGMSNANYALYQQLQQLSPWLSTEVLLAYTEHSAPNSNEKETLLTTNPDGVKGTELNNSIENGGWFTSQQIITIKAAAQNTTTRTQLESDLRSAQSELQGITQALENYYQIDEADNGLDYANQATWAANGESLDGYLRSIDNRLWAGDVTTAQNEITAVQAMDMTTTQAQEVSFFVQLKNLEVDLINSNRSYDEATSTEIGDLQTIAAQSTGRAGIQAQNWLHLLGISEAQAEAYWGSSSPALMSGGNVPFAEEQAPTMPEYIQVHPNPSTGIFRFHYQPQEELAEGTIVIYDLSGQQVHQQAIASGSHFNWQPAQQEAGFYFFALKDKKGALLQQGKLVYMPE